MNLSPAAFDEIRKTVHQLCGIVIADDKEYLVKARLEPVVRANGLVSYESYIEQLNNPGSLALKEQTIEAIATNETSFNRDGHPFAELKRSILPELAARVIERKAVAPHSYLRARIWCAAVATGQEAYSTAMAVADFLAEGSATGLALTDFPIVATDISTSALAIARAARYSSAELARGLSTDQKTRYLRADGNGWIIDEKLRGMIEFRRLNLVHPLPSLGPFDLILCRNFLIYLDEPTRRRLCDTLHRMLAPRGILILGAAESLYGVTDLFATERIGSTVVYRSR
jgi:chemotaxis protein methyltransferase CheR